MSWKQTSLFFVRTGIAAAFVFVTFAPWCVLAQNVPPSPPSLVLFWGNEDGSDPAQVRIENGGTYDVSLGKDAPIFFSFTDGVDRTNMSGTLSRIISPMDSESVETKEFITRIVSHGSGETIFAWPEEGTYELSVFIIPAFMESRGPSVFAWLVGDVAHADVIPLPPSLPQRIRFTIYAAPRCVQDCFSNVLFLPGIESSRLYRPGDDGGEDKLWEPNVNDDVRDLFLTPEGESIRTDVYAKEGDVLDEIPVTGANVYKSFLDRMEALKSSGAINDWEAAAYDWRLTLDDILQYGQNIDGKIYYAGDQRATSTPYIVQELRRLAATSKSGKVTIVAHSNGGLVAKRLTEILGAEASELIDRMIFVAVPQAGTPMAIPAALHGYEQSHGPFGIVTSEATARAFASTSPMAYQLLPSAQYFTYVDDPVVSFDASLPEWQAHYGETVHSAERLRQFITDAYGKTTGDDTRTPIQLSSDLLARAEVLHQTLDTWVPPQGVELIQIAGWGVPKTVSGITYEAHGDGVQATPRFTIDGDGTVVVPSALWTSTTTGVKNYWVDLKRYNKDNVIKTGFGLVPFDHARILDVSPIEDCIDNVMRGSQDCSGSYLGIDIPQNGHQYLMYALHSPLTLDLYDEQGNHTGVATSTGMVEENIPGTYFVQFGDITYIFADTGTPQHIVMSGYDTGTFTFEIGEMLGNNEVSNIVFRDVPTTPQTKVRFDISDGLASASDMALDEDGDGTFETSYASSTGERIVPQIVVSPAPAGGNGMPVSNGVSIPMPEVATTTLATTTPVVQETVVSVEEPVKEIKPPVPPKQKLAPPRIVQKAPSVTHASGTLVASAASAEIPRADFLARLSNFLKKIFHSIF